MKWITDNSLPEIAQPVLISSQWSKVFLGERQPLGRLGKLYYWWTPTQIFNAGDIIAWMPLPEPYIPAKSENMK